MPVNRDQVKKQFGHTLRDTRFSKLGERYQGKVRDTYAGDELIFLVTTDRISAFDHVLRQTIPFKGQVLNRLAAFQFKRTADIIENHVVSVPDPNVTIARRCDALPVEFVVRGYLAGHAWRTYDSGVHALCGVKLDEGLRENSRLSAPILTPATKADVGHDEDISVDDIVKRGILDKETVDLLTQKSFSLFERGTQIAANNELILVDTKYEFGRLPGGKLILIDEIHTADSSRYFYSDSYEELLRLDKPQRQLSKEFVRVWLMENGFQGFVGQALPDLDDEFVIDISLRYIELFEKLTGDVFIPDMHPDPEQRIRENMNKPVANWTVGN